MMEATFDYVCHPLRCGSCGTVPLDPCAIDLQTKVAARKSLRSLRVGDTVGLAPDLGAEGYLRVGTDPATSIVRVVETWSCPSCGSSTQWARLTIADNILRDVESVSLDETVLTESDYITSEALLLVPLERVPLLRTMVPAALRRELAAAALVENDPGDT
jgi:hypothetical protein